MSLDFLLKKEDNDFLNSGKIHVYTGEGKGKTTAALGLAVRAVGAGKKVAVIYFDKGGSHYSERKVLDKIKDQNVDYFSTGLDRINPDTGEFRFGVEKEDIKEAQRGMDIAFKIADSAKYDVLILDEINPVVSLGILPVEDILKFLDKKPFYLELILTGRNCHDKVLEKADLITEMKEIKHYFQKGLKARKGIDY